MLSQVCLHQARSAELAIFARHTVPADYIPRILYAQKEQLILRPLEDLWVMDWRALVASHLHQQRCRY